MGAVIRGSRVGTPLTARCGCTVVMLNSAVRKNSMTVAVTKLYPSVRKNRPSLSNEYCRYKTVGESVCNILNDSNVQIHLISSRFSNSDRRRIQSNIDKFKNVNSKTQNTICAQARLSSQVHSGKQTTMQYPEEESK